MRDGRFYQKLVSKMNEVAIVPPQEIGSLTFIYKRVVPLLKFYPWRSALIFSFVFSLFAYLILGATLVKLASILQIGF